MSCSPIELKEYFLKELPHLQQWEMEAHIKSCQVCREELDRLQLTEAALMSLREEEIPQRIAFVSDKMFEPSPWRRRWAVFWGSGARLGFASAAMLSVALLVSAWMRTAPSGHVSGAHTTPPVVAGISDADIQTRIDNAVAKAVAAADARQTEKTAQLMADLVDARRKLLLAAAEFDMSEKRDTARRLSASAYEMPHVGGGEGK